MKKIVITQGAAEDFFFRGKALARRLDRHERIGASNVAATITFEDIGDLLHALSPARLDLIVTPWRVRAVPQRLHGRLRRAGGGESDSGAD